jgi:GNAT superfamily N-acetyltransferase
MAELSIRVATMAHAPAILALADRLAAFGPTTRAPAEIADRERAALGDALARPSPGSCLLVAEQPPHGVVGVVFLETRQDYFTDRRHGYVAILAVAGEAEGRGVGRALLKAAEDWGRANGLTKLTLAVFTDNRRAKDFYERQGWRPELETWYQELGVDEGAA